MNFSKFSFMQIMGEDKNQTKFSEYVGHLYSTRNEFSEIAGHS